MHFKMYFIEINTAGYNKFHFCLLAHWASEILFHLPGISREKPDQFTSQTCVMLTPHSSLAVQTYITCVGLEMKSVPSLSCYAEFFKINLKLQWCI